jgi:Nif-specific regulatory protein
VGRLTLDSSQGFVRQDGRPESGAPSLNAPMQVPPAESGDERQRLVRAMESSAWVQAKAARLLGLTPRQIGYALRKYDVPIKRF